jgi:hypothetical protein
LPLLFRQFVFQFVYYKYDKGNLFDSRAGPPLDLKKYLVKRVTFEHPLGGTYAVLPEVKRKHIWPFSARFILKVKGLVTAKLRKTFEDKIKAVWSAVDQSKYLRYISNDINSEEAYVVLEIREC